jgi:hypothetical protein
MRDVRGMTWWFVSSICDWIDGQTDEAGKDG